MDVQLLLICPSERENWTFQPDTHSHYFVVFRDIRLLNPQMGSNFMDIWLNYWFLKFHDFLCYRGFPIIK